MNFRRRQKVLIALLTLSIAFVAGVSNDVKAAGDSLLTSQIDMSAPIGLERANQAKVTNLYYDQINLRPLLRMLGRYANINMVLDETVQGSISIAFDEVSVKDALEYLQKIAGLYYVSKGNNILLVTTKSEADTKGLSRTVSKIIPVKYVNAKLIEALLNTTVFRSTGSSSSDDATKATSEFRTNSVIVVGTDNDIRLAEELITRVDVPRERKTFNINHATPVEVAQLLQASVFNDGINPFNNSGGSGGAESLPSQGTQVSVNVETYEEGSGAATEVQGASGEGGGGEEQTFTLRTKTISTEEISISPDGPIIVPDTRTNTLTILGTIEQLALAEAVIPNLDQKLPQVAIEASLLELYDTHQRENKMTYGGSSGQFASGFNNTTVPLTPTGGDPGVVHRPDQPIQLADGTYSWPGVLNNVIGLPTSRDQGEEGFAFNWTTVPLERSKEFLVQVDNILAKRKAKLLANPTIIAVHNSEAIISITEEIIRRTTVTRDATGFQQTQVEIGEAGIILNIIPKISSDGSVTMRIRPSVSTIASITTDPSGNIITLLNRRDLAVQEVRVANNQTLVVGGLIQERDNARNAKVPGIASLPIVGALFRTQYKDSSRSELVTLVTPRILEDSKPFSPQRISQLMRNPDIQELMKKSSNSTLDKHQNQ